MIVTNQSDNLPPDEWPLTNQSERLLQNNELLLANERRVQVTKHGGVHQPIK